MLAVRDGEEPRRQRSSRQGALPQDLRLSAGAAVVGAEGARRTLGGRARERVATIRTTRPSGCMTGSRRKGPTGAARAWKGPAGAARAWRGPAGAARARYGAPGIGLARRHRSQRSNRSARFGGIRAESPDRRNGDSGRGSYLATCIAVDAAGWATAAHAPAVVVLGPSCLATAASSPGAARAIPTSWRDSSFGPHPNRGVLAGRGSEAVHRHVGDGGVSSPDRWLALSKGETYQRPKGRRAAAGRSWNALARRLRFGA